MSKKSGKSSARGPTPQLRSRNTRSSRGRLLTDTASSNVLLTNQLRSLGLYAAHTIGDGNCLFRALSDQLYGSPSKHPELRQTICDWIEKHKSRYEPFVEDERGLEQHLRCMRENGTYGGHMELSAFAHLTKRNVKVVQPGLVYIIEWASGWDSISGDASPSTQTSSSSADTVESSISPSSSSTSISTRRRSLRAVTDKEKDKQRRREKAEQSEKIRTGKHGYYVYEEVTSESENEGVVPLDVDKAPASAHASGSSAVEPEGNGGTIYVAYHDWEHFSSIRNLNGPHTGLPLVCETPGENVSHPSLEEREHEDAKEREREKKKERKVLSKGSKAKEKDREGSHQPSSSSNEKREPLKVKLKLSSRSSTVAPASTSTASTSTGTSPPLSVASSTSSVLTDLSATSTVVASNTHSLCLADDPSAIPLPTSRSASPFPSALSTVSSSSGSSANLSMNPPYPLSPPPQAAPSYHARQMHLQSVHVRTNRSPKRSFDESSASTSGGEAEGGSASGREEKRTRRADREKDVDESKEAGGDEEGKEGAVNMDVDQGGSGSESEFDDDEDDEEEEDNEKKKSEESKLPSLSNLGGTTTTTKKLKPKHERMLGSGKPLTRRQRKALGLPKRGNGAGDVADPVSAGKIVIPGGKWKGGRSATAPPVSSAKGMDVGSGEWLQNGSGRLDVRGFRELKI